MACSARVSVKISVTQHQRATRPCREPLALHDQAGPWASYRPAATLAPGTEREEAVRTNAGAPRAQRLEQHPGLQEHRLRLAGQPACNGERAPVQLRRVAGELPAINVLRYYHIALSLPGQLVNLTLGATAQCDGGKTRATAVLYVQRMVTVKPVQCGFSKQ